MALKKYNITDKIVRHRVEGRVARYFSELSNQQLEEKIKNNTPELVNSTRIINGKTYRWIRVLPWAFKNELKRRKIALILKKHENT